MRTHIRKKALRQRIFLAISVIVLALVIILTF
jgi:hypothetical protein